MDSETARKWDKLDIAYMSAICAPYANLETLRLMNDWNGWVFTFDDRKWTRCLIPLNYIRSGRDHRLSKTPCSSTEFDEGHLQHDLLQAAQEIIQTIAMLDDISPVVSTDESLLRHTLQSCWLRFRKRASPELQYRWKQHLTWYCLGVLRQVGMQTVKYNPTVEEYMDFRSGCIGVYPCIGLME